MRQGCIGLHQGASTDKQRRPHPLPRPSFSWAVSGGYEFQRLNHSHPSRLPLPGNMFHNQRSSIRLQVNRLAHQRCAPRGYSLAVSATCQLHRLSSSTLHHICTVLASVPSVGRTPHLIATAADATTRGDRSPTRQRREMRGRECHDCTLSRLTSSSSANEFLTPPEQRSRIPAHHPKGCCK